MGLTAENLSAPRAAVTPLSPDRYKLQLTIGGDILEKLRLAKDMLSHAIPSGDDAAVLDRALTALLVDLARKKFADTPNLFLDTSWWTPANVLAAMKLVPPGRILNAWADRSWAEPQPRSRPLLRRP